MKCSFALGLCLALIPLFPSARASAQEPRPHRLEVAAGGGFMTSGSYFTGPGALALAADNALALAGRAPRKERSD